MRQEVESDPSPADPCARRALPLPQALGTSRGGAVMHANRGKEGPGRTRLGAGACGLRLGQPFHKDVQLAAHRARQAACRAEQAARFSSREFGGRARVPCRLPGLPGLLPSLTHMLPADVQGRSCGWRAQLLLVLLLECSHLDSTPEPGISRHAECMGQRARQRCPCLLQPSRRTPQT